ncbi:MAG: glycine dehydrogenase, partial [Betaproteobacteria bacterium]|nr:glycine dehydrogenase [Betaproteobacteria bacterium]
AFAGIAGVSLPFSGSIFHEFVIQVQTPVAPMLQALQAEGILGGYSLVDDYKAPRQSLLVCATETKTAADIERYAETLTRIVDRGVRPVTSAIKPT